MCVWRVPFKVKLGKAVAKRKIACQVAAWLMITKFLGRLAGLPVNKHESMALVDVQLLHGRKLM